MAIRAEEFAKMNIMAGTARGLERSSLSGEDQEVWNRDFDLLVNDLKRVIDPEIGAELEREKDLYTSACEVAKGYFNDKSLGGLKCSTGQFGFRLIGPQDLKTDSAGATPAFYSWRQKVDTTTGKTYKQYLFGYGTAAVYAKDAANKQAVLAFHRLISYKPDPRLILVQFEINDYPYVPYNVELFSSIAKENKLFKIIPMPGRVILHPGGHFFMHAYFDRQTGATAPALIGSMDVELALFGLVFAEHDYLAADQLT